MTYDAIYWKYGDMIHIHSNCSGSASARKPRNPDTSKLGHWLAITSGMGNSYHVPLLSPTESFFVGLHLNQLWCPAESFRRFPCECIRDSDRKPKIPRKLVFEFGEYLDSVIPTI
jgi:hypothetical protein